MYIDTWQWFYDFQRQAIRDNNLSLLELPQKYRQAWRYLEAAQYADAIRLFIEGIDLAKQKQLPMWEFFFESWVCEVNVLAANYTEALNWTTRLVTKSVLPQHRDHPVRAVVYFTLAWVYSYIDAIGYEDDIIQALDTLEGGMPIDEETHHRSIFLRSEIAYEKERYEEAKKHNDHYMSLVEGNHFRESSGYGMQRMLAYQAGNLVQALQACDMRERVSRKTRLLNNAANSVLWQGVIKQYLGDERDALQKIQQGMSEYELRNLSKQRGYYHILASYYTATGDFDTALDYRDHELAIAIQSGSIGNEFQCRLDRCYLFNKMGRDVSKEIAAITTLAHRSKKPQNHLSKVELARQGRTARHDWQLAL